MGVFTSPRQKIILKHSMIFFMNPYTKKVFISYVKEDSEQVDELCKVLRQREFLTGAIASPLGQVMLGGKRFERLFVKGQWSSWHAFQITQIQNANPI